MVGAQPRGNFGALGGLWWTFWTWHISAGVTGKDWVLENARFFGNLFEAIFFWSPTVLYFIEPWYFSWEISGDRHLQWIANEIRQHVKEHELERFTKKQHDFTKDLDFQVHFRYEATKAWSIMSRCTFRSELISSDIEPDCWLEPQINPLGL